MVVHKTDYWDLNNFFESNLNPFNGPNLWWPKWTHTFTYVPKRLISIDPKSFKANKINKTMLKSHTFRTWRSTLLYVLFWFCLVEETPIGGCKLLLIVNLKRDNRRNKNGGEISDPNPIPNARIAKTLLSHKGSISGGWKHNSLSHASPHVRRSILLLFLMI